MKKAALLLVKAFQVDRTFSIISKATGSKISTNYGPHGMRIRL
jgi:hypothetical protein